MDSTDGIMEMDSLFRRVDFSSEYDTEGELFSRIMARIPKHFPKSRDELDDDDLDRISAAGRALPTERGDKEWTIRP